MIVQQVADGTMSGFIRRREVILAPTYRENQELNFEHWSMERVQRYINMLSAFGYNSLQLCEVQAALGGHKAAGFRTLDALADRINAIADCAGRTGMERSLFIWAQILFELSRIYCPSDASDRAVIEEEYERMARTYAPHFDHIIAYWGEPGPCMQRCARCTYSTYQFMTALLAKKFRRYNPNIRATLNIWGLMRKERAGRLADKTREILLDPKSNRLLERPVANKDVIQRLEADGPIVDDAKRLQSMSELATSISLPKDIGICLDGCTTGALTWSGPATLRFDEIEMIARSGRPVGVWGWYLTDYEGTERSDLELRRVSDYFESMPRGIGKMLDWHSVEITSHGWPPIILNVYVAGRKMQDPTSPLEQILAEFCEGYYGKELAPIMLGSYLLLDKAPLVSRPLSKVRIVNLLGTERYEQEARGWLEKLEAVTADPDAQPRFPVIVEPEEMRLFAVQRLKRTIAISERLREFQNEHTS